MEGLIAGERGTSEERKEDTRRMRWQLVAARNRRASHTLRAGGWDTIPFRTSPLILLKRGHFSVVTVAFTTIAVT